MSIGIDWFGVVLEILAMVAVIVAVTAIVFYTWRFLERLTRNRE